MRLIDLFCGAGGASLGAEAAGLEVVGAYDHSATAIRGHRALMPDTPAHQVDLEVVDASELAEADATWASPPCQPFSQGGARGADADHRNGYPWLLRLMRERPTRWLVIENVPGLAQHARTAGCRAPLFPLGSGCSGCYLEHVRGELEQLFPVVELRELNAADYGLPQERKRLITVCGPRRIEWPTPTHGPGLLPYTAAGTCVDWDTVPGFEGLARVFVPAGRPASSRTSERTWRDATDTPAGTVPAQTGGGTAAACLGVVLEHSGSRGGTRPGGAPCLYREVSAPAPVVTSAGDLRLAVGGPNANNGAGPRMWGVDQPAPTVRTHADCSIVAAGAGEGRPRSVTLPAPTVTGGGTSQLVAPGSSHEEFGSRKHLQGFWRLRTLTVVERARLQGLPWHKALTGTTVGNAVPPILAEVVLRAVRAADGR